MMYRVEEPAQTNIIVNYLPADMADQDLYDLFKCYGKIRQHKIVRVKATGRSLGYGFVDFAMDISAEAALRFANKLEYRGKRLKVDLARPRTGEYTNTNLFVSYIPRAVDQDQLHALFEPYGPIIDLKILRDKDTGDSRGLAFIRLELHSAAQKAIDKLHNRHTFEGASRAIAVQFSRRPENQGRKAFPNGVERVKPSERATALPDSEEEKEAYNNEILYRTPRMLEQYKILCSLSRRRDEDVWSPPRNKVPPLKCDVEAEDEKPEMPSGVSVGVGGDVWFWPSNKVPPLKSAIKAEKEKPEIPDETPKRPRGVAGLQELVGWAEYIDLEMVLWMWFAILLGVIAFYFCDTFIF